MKNYSIVRIGNEYVVQADEKSVLKIASRRRAARLVTDAAELLDSQPAAPLSADIGAEPSIDPDPRVMPDPGGVSDPGTTADPSEAS
jgi:aconitase B